MSWKEYLIYRARKTAGRRRLLYGTEPAPEVTGLLTKQDISLNFREAYKLLVYIFFKSPRRRLRLLWQHLTDRDTPSRRRQIDRLAQDLQIQLSEHSRVSANFFERNNCSRDLARVPTLMEKALHRTTPFLVVQPGNEQDIAHVLAFCQSKKLALFPRGSASFAFGGAVPTQNGIVMDLSPMMAILEIDPEERKVRVQPGARWADVATKLEPHGLVPMTTPTSRFSTVAGWISTGGLGLDSFAYGNVYESVLGVRVARPDGTIEELDAKQESIKDLFGTEGHLGILTEVTFRVRPKPEYSGTCLLTFENPEQSFALIKQLSNSDHQPSHVVFFDQEYMKRENTLFTEHLKMEEPVVPEQDAVLLHFETPESELEFLTSLNGKSNHVAENKVAARYLWADRFFPLKAQRIGPGLLGSEVIVPQENVLNYIAKVRKLARHFNIIPTIEVIVFRHGESHKNLVIMAFSCDYSRTIHYDISLLFIQLLVRMAVKLGGSPYGIGIWNTPFVKSKYTPNQFGRLKAIKHKIDPADILNPNKFFKIKGRFHNIPALAMRPIVFHTILAVSHFLAPILGFVAKISQPEQHSHWDVPDKDTEQGKSLLYQSSQRCTSCGSCISVCPAYHITRDELVTGRTKLRMADAMINGMKLSQAEAHSPFQCLQCGLCEEVCQTRLPLRDCYLILESWIENRFGSHEETVQRFVEQLNDNREFIKDTFGLDLPDWSPDEQMSRVPAAERPQKEGQA
ncbi:FAD-binding protein [Acidobacteriota bacterium]